MVAPRLPNHSKRNRRRKGGPQQNHHIATAVERQRVLLIPLGLAVLAIVYNIVRLWRSLVRPTATTNTHALHREHVAVSSWSFEWCDNHERGCVYYLPLDLQDFLPLSIIPDEPLLDIMNVVPDMQDIGELFEADDDSNNSSTRIMTDDLDNHLDRLGNMLMNPTKYVYQPTPRVLVEARHNITLGRTNYTLKKSQQQQHGGHHFALLSRRGLGGSHFYNQDRAVLIDPYPVLMTKKQTRTRQSHPLHNNFLLGIFDGHGPSGHVKADFASTTLPKFLLDRLSSKVHDNNNNHQQHQYSDDPHIIRAAFRSSFWEAHRQGPLIHDSGCTASMIVRLRQHLYFANTGDSRSFLLRIDASTGAVNVTHTTKPHKPNDPMERHRIVGAGCIVIDPDPLHDPTARVAEPGDGTGMALAMSRSLGDYDLEHCGVIPEPTVTVIDLDQYTQKGVILLAVSVTDGMFDYVPLDEIATGLSLPFLTRNSYFASEASPLELAAEDLIRRASDRWLENTTMYPYRDDITIAVRRVQ